VFVPAGVYHAAISASATERPNEPLRAVIIKSPPDEEKERSGS
jgi:uncharacterized RmlC-like cupin family protein